MGFHLFTLPYDEVCGMSSAEIRTLLEEKGHDTVEISLDDVFDLPTYTALQVTTRGSRTRFFTLEEDLLAEYLPAKCVKSKLVEVQHEFSEVIPPDTLYFGAYGGDVLVEGWLDLGSMTIGDFCNAYLFELSEAMRAAMRDN